MTQPDSTTNSLEACLVDENENGSSSSVIASTRPVLKISLVLAAASSLAFAAIFLLHPQTDDHVSAVLKMYPNLETVEEVNELFEKLPVHDQHEKVFDHVASRAEPLFKSFLRSYGSSAPDWTNGKMPTHARRSIDGEEFRHRLAVFKETLKSIIKLNIHEARHNTRRNRAVFGVTKFADWKWDEFKTLLKHNNGVSENATVTDLSWGLKGSSTPPCSKNWAAENRDVFIPRNQDQCGSCYAHAAAEEMRALAFIETGIDPGELSVQYIVDCKGNGCSGGDASNVMDWIQGQGGIPTKAAYGPYLSSAGTCKRDVPFAVTTDGAQRHYSESGTADAMCNQGPTSMGVYVNNAFQSYRKGVLSHHSCPAEMNNHDTQAVAVLADQGAWLIRNSWGEEWGVDPVNFQPGSHAGFILLEYGFNTCGVEQCNGIPQNVRCPGGSCTGAAPAPPPADDDPVCNDNCMWSEDGECDEDFLCAEGTDCTDCDGAPADLCSTCTSYALGPGEVCILLDGTCSTPDNAYYCEDSAGYIRVTSCDGDTEMMLAKKVDAGLEDIAKPIQPILAAEGNHAKGSASHETKQATKKHTQEYKAAKLEAKKKAMQDKVHN